MVHRHHTPLNDRLDALRGFDTEDETRSDLDALVRQAAAAFQAPMALVSILGAERQWFKAKFGLTLSETPLASSFCVHAVRGTGVFSVCDAADDSRFASNPLVTGEPHIRFYAGAPVRQGGLRTGSLCVLDQKPREAISSLQTRYLALLAEQATAILLRDEAGR